MTPEIRIALATAADTPAILDLIRALADYEHLADHVTATEERLRKGLFGERPGAEALLAYADAEPVGLAVFFHNFSTFLGQPGLYLEDLVVRREWRARQIGRRLFARVAQIALERGCGRMEWAVLDWNTPAIGFYKRLGAEAMDGWTLYRLSGRELQDAANERPRTSGPTGR